MNPNFKNTYRAYKPKKTAEQIVNELYGFQEPLNKEDYQILKGALKELKDLKALIAVAKEHLLGDYSKFEESIYKLLGLER